MPSLTQEPHPLDATPGPAHFVDHYFWGCVEGHRLNLAWRRLAATSPSSASRDLLQAEVDCFAHIQICSRCLPLELLACREGHALMEAWDVERDRSRHQAASPVFATPGRHSTASLKLSFTRSPAHTSFLNHKRTCPTCLARPPLGRYTFQAWTPNGASAARALRLD